MKKYIAHRGIFLNDIKENTKESIILALNNKKYYGVEFDVRITKDNKFVLYHNATYNGKRIANIRYNELPKYVPLLEEILKIESNKLFLIEVKNISNNYKQFIKLLNKYKNKNIYVMSFSNQIIKNLNNDNKTYKVGVLNYILNTFDIDDLDFVGIINKLINKDIISSLKNKEIFSYGIGNNMEFDNLYYIVDDK